MPDSEPEKQLCVLAEEESFSLKTRGGYAIVRVVW